MSGAVRSSGSVRRRLAVQLILAAALLAGLLIFIFQSFSRQIATESADSILLASATAILDSVSVQQGEVTVDIPYAALSMLGSVSDDRVFYRLDLNGGLLTGYDDLPVAVTDGASGFETAQYAGADVRLVSVTRTLATGSETAEVRATVAQTQDGLAVRLSSLFRQALALGVAFFLVAAILAVLAANSALRPLRALARSISRRGPRDLRQFTAHVPEEMGPLVASLNRFTERLSRALSRSEDFITEAAHRVRTPLATVRAQAEVLHRTVRREENKASLRRMIRAIDESSRAAGQLLDQAMVTLRTDALNREETDLGPLIEETVDRLRPVAELRDIAVEARLTPGVGAAVDRILIQNALTNVLDNAVKYAPSESRVEVVLEQGAVISVRDQGPGFPADGAERLLDRFVRGDNTGQTIGSGLGLTIAAEVLDAHGGRIELRNRQGAQGACVDLHLPQ